MAPSCFTGQQRGRSADGESARIRGAPPGSPNTTRIHDAGFIRTHSGGRPAGPSEVRDLRNATAHHCAGDPIDVAAAVVSAMRTRLADNLMFPEQVGTMDLRTIAFEVLAVTQSTPHCLRISLLPQDGWTCELTSGQELSLMLNGRKGLPFRWIVRELDPQTTQLSVGAVLGLSSLDAGRWRSSLVPGEVLWGTTSVPRRSAAYGLPSADVICGDSSRRPQSEIHPERFVHRLDWNPRVPRKRKVVMGYVND